MNWLLLADDISSRPDNKLQEIYNAVVRDMPWGGLGMMTVLIALTLISVIWIAWSQRRLAINQVRTAELLARHLAEHETHKAEHARHDAEHGKK